MSINKQGYEIKNEIIPISLLKAFTTEWQTKVKTESSHGIRNAEKKFESINKIVKHLSLIETATNILNGNPKLVRTIVFDKTPEKNWLVTWHQDKTVAVSDKFDAEGWGPWTIKDNTHHVQPPIEVLEGMVTFRIHVDPADENNGCLRVIPFSHQKGILAQHEIDALVKKSIPVNCTANAGDTLIMRPHILHSSSKALNPSHRRIIHIEYSSYPLPYGIHWT